MTNIPTDLLRTLVAVVDLRSFTKASVLLGLTQPAVSAQIKRLQSLLGGDLFDRSVQGVSLTPQGEVVVSYARRLLSINDQIVQFGANDVRTELVIRVGTSGDYVTTILPATLARFRQQFADVRFLVRTGSYDSLLRDLRSGGLDIALGLSINPPADARHVFMKDVVWACGPSPRLDLESPVPLVSYGEHSAYHQVAVAALQKAGLNWEVVFSSPNVGSLRAAIAAGFGVMPTGRRVAKGTGMTVWENAPLPKLPNLYSGIYVREGGEQTIYERLADDIAEGLYSHAERPAPTLVVNSQRKANPAA